MGNQQPGVLMKNLIILAALSSASLVEAQSYTGSNPSYDNSSYSNQSVDSGDSYTTQTSPSSSSQTSTSPTSSSYQTPSTSAASSTGAATTTAPDPKQAARDQELAKKVRDTLTTVLVSSQGQHHVTFEVFNGTVILNGTVELPEDKKNIEKSIKRISGVRNINNNISTDQSPTSANQRNSSYTADQGKKRS